MKGADAYVPDSFDNLPETMSEPLAQLVEEGEITATLEGKTPQAPMDCTWIKKLDMVCEPANFSSGIADDRGEALEHSGVTISEVFDEGMGLGGACSFLWFRRQLTKACTKFIEMILLITADPGPTVSGAYNTIATPRAGKDPVSAPCSGLLATGPRFGGAFDDAAKMFAKAHDGSARPKDSIMRRKPSQKA